MVKLEPSGESFNRALCSIRIFLADIEYEVPEVVVGSGCAM